MKTKIALWIVSILLMGMIVLHEMQINNAFRPLIRVHAGEQRIPEVAPGDTFDTALPIWNHSWKLASISDAMGSCRVARVLAPQTIASKHKGFLLVRIVAPEEPGDYSENIILRANTKNVFEAAVVRYRVKAPVVAMR